MIHLKHKSGLVKVCPIGYSWTTFFFGPFVVLYRGMGAGLFFVFFLLQVVTYGITGIVVAFWINKEYAKQLILQGYKPVTKMDSYHLERWRILIESLESKEKKIKDKAA